MIVSSHYPTKRVLASIWKFLAIGFFRSSSTKREKTKVSTAIFWQNKETKQKNILLLKNLEFHLRICIVLVYPFDLMKEDIEEDCWNLEAQRETVTPL